MLAIVIDMEFSQLRLAVDDFGTMFRFYRDIVGLSPQVDNESGPYGKFTWASGGSALALQLRTQVAAAIGDNRSRWMGGILIAIRVDDVATVLAQLRSRGAALLNDPHDDWGMRVFHVADPEGHVLEFQQWPKR